jgi:hypothetical protein
MVGSWGPTVGAAALLLSVCCYCVGWLLSLFNCAVWFQSSTYGNHAVAIVSCESRVLQVSRGKPPLLHYLWGICRRLAPPRGCGGSQITALLLVVGGGGRISLPGIHAEWQLAGAFVRGELVAAERKGIQSCLRSHEQNTESAEKDPEGPTHSIMHCRGKFRSHAAAPRAVALMLFHEVKYSGLGLSQ